MGTDITSWDAYLAAMGTDGGPTGAYYVGYGSGEWLWLIVAIVLCIVPLVIGSRHELDAYRKLKSRQK